MEKCNPNDRCIDCDVTVAEENVYQFDRCPKCDEFLCFYCLHEREHKCKEK